MLSSIAGTSPTERRRDDGARVRYGRQRDGRQPLLINSTRQIRPSVLRALRGRTDRRADRENRRNGQNGRDRQDGRTGYTGKTGRTERTGRRRLLHPAGRHADLHQRRRRPRDDRDQVAPGRELPRQRDSAGRHDRRGRFRLGELHARRRLRHQSEMFASSSGAGNRFRRVGSIPLSISVARRRCEHRDGRLHELSSRRRGLCRRRERSDLSGSDEHAG